MVTNNLIVRDHTLCRTLTDSRWSPVSNSDTSQWHSKAFPLKFMFVVQTYLWLCCRTECRPRSLDSSRRLRFSAGPVWSHSPSLYRSAPRNLPGSPVPVKSLLFIGETTELANNYTGFMYSDLMGGGASRVVGSGVSQTGALTGTDQAPDQTQCRHSNIPTVLASPLVQNAQMFKSTSHTV